MISVILSTSVFAMDAKEDQTGPRGIAVHASPTERSTECNDPNCICKPTSRTTASPTVVNSDCGVLGCIACHPSVSPTVIMPTVVNLPCGPECTVCNPDLSKISNQNGK